MSMRPPTPAPPATVRLAATLLLAVAAVLVVRAAFTYLWFDSLIDAYAERQGISDLPRETIESRAPGYKSFALANAVLFGAVLAVCAAFVLRGAGWARIVATVIGVLGLLGGLLSVLQPAPPAFVLLALLVVAGLVAALLVLWLPASSEYVRARRLTSTQPG